MKKLSVNIIYILFLIVSFNLALAQAQDTESFKDKNFPEKGRFAVVFEIGTLFGSSSFFEGYNFLAKYHLSDKAALRVNFHFDNGDLNRFQPDITDWSSYKYEANANVQFYLSNKTFVKPFISIGPVYSRNHYFVHSIILLSHGREYQEEEFRNEWRLGVMFTLGTEVFIYNNVSLIGEYVLKGTYGKHEEYQLKSSDYYDDNNYNFSSFTANTARLGFSVYF